MLTKTIGQLSAAASITTADKIEIEQSGASKYGTVTQVGISIASSTTAISSFSVALGATSAQSIAGSSSDVFISPATFRAGINAENTAPIYACRAWCNFDGTTAASSISGTYTRIVGTTLTVCVATAHGMITGNAIYVDFTSGGGSDNTYIVTVVDTDTFTVNTVSTSSILTSNFTLPRSPIYASGNISCVSRTATGYYIINFAAPMPNEYYSIAFSTYYTTGVFPLVQSDLPPTIYAFKMSTQAFGGGFTAYDRTTVAVFG